MIKINLYDYREELNRVSIQKRLLTSASIVVAALFMILFSWLIEKSRISAVDMEVKDLKQQINVLQATVDLVRTMQAKQKRVGSILAGIENLRINQLPATEILFDINMGVPEAVWLTNIAQMDKSELAKNRVPTILFKNAADKGTKKAKSKKAKRKGKKKGPKEFIQISGYAMENKSVARFVERLEEIPYFKIVFLFKTERTLIGNTKVREFSIYCYMPVNSNKTVA